MISGFPQNSTISLRSCLQQLHLHLHLPLSETCVESLLPLSHGLLGGLCRVMDQSSTRLHVSCSDDLL